MGELVTAVSRAQANVDSLNLDLGGLQDEAEKKAAALPPKLTVPMILFFLPVLFVVILGPAACAISDQFLNR